MKLVTKILMDNKQSMLENLNMDRTMGMELSASQGRPPNLSSQAALDLFLEKTSGSKTKAQPMAKLHIPRSTRLKADRARTYLEHFYSILEKSMTVDSVNHHSGIEGVYNPLQVIRNRKIKKKNHDNVANEITITRAPIIAIKELSQRPHNKTKWYVDVNEKYYDLSWRAHHWDELVGPDGHLWYGKKHKGLRKHLHRTHHRDHSDLKVAQEPTSGLPKSLQSSDSISSSDYSRGDFRIPKPMDMIPNPLGLIGITDIPIIALQGTKDITSNLNESPNKTNSNSLNKTYSNAESNITRRDSDDLISSHLELSVKPRKDHVDRLAPSTHKLDKIKSKGKKWTKKSPSTHKKSGSTSSVYHGVENLEYEDTYPTSHSKNASIENNFVTSGSSGNSNHFMTAVEPISSKFKSSLLNDIPIQHLQPKSKEKINLGLEKDSKQQSVREKEEYETNKEINIDERDGIDEEDIDQSRAGKLPVDANLYNHWNQTRYLMTTLAMIQHRSHTHDIVKRREINKRNRIEVVNDADENVQKTTELLREYEVELNKVLKVGNHWTSKLLNDYSIRVENLVSASDRILSDINTTLTLKLKLAQENSERYGNMQMMRIPRVMKILYIFLECFIVAILWTVWLLVSILKPVKSFFVMTFKLIKVLLW